MEGRKRAYPSELPDRLPTDKPTDEKADKRRLSVFLIVVYLYLSPLSPICRYVGGHHSRNAFLPGFVCVRSRARGHRHFIPPLSQLKSLRRVSTLRTPEATSAPGQNAPDAAQVAPCPRRAKPAAPPAPPEGKPVWGDLARSSKIGLGSSPGASGEEGAGRSRTTDESLFYRVKPLTGRKTGGCAARRAAQGEGRCQRFRT